MPKKAEADQAAELFFSIIGGIFTFLELATQLIFILVHGIFFMYIFREWWHGRLPMN